MNFTHSQAKNKVTDVESNGTTREDYEGSKDAEGSTNDDVAEEDWQMEWRIVGKTLDRCLFVFFAVVFIIGVAVCFGIQF